MTRILIFIFMRRLYASCQMYVMGKMKSNKQQNYTHRTLSPSLKDFSKAKSDYFLIPRTILVALLRSSFRETRKSDLTGPELRYIESPSSHNHRSPQTPTKTSHNTKQMGGFGQRACAKQSSASSASFVFVL